MKSKKTETNTKSPKKKSSFWQLSKNKQNKKSLKTSVSSILVVGSIFVIFVGGIASALYLSFNSIIREKPINENSKILQINNPNNSQELNFKDIKKNAEIPEFLDQKQASLYQKLLVEFLYQKEYENSFKYSALFNKIRGLTPNDSSYMQPIKTMVEIEKREKQNLEDQKKLFQERYGIKNWAQKFSEELRNNPSYGNAINEEQAIDFKTHSEMQNTAFAKYQLSFNSVFSLKDKEGIISSDPLTFTNFDKKTQKIPLTNDKKIKFNFLNNAFLPKNNQENQNNNIKVVEILDNSLDSDRKNKRDQFLNFLKEKKYYFLTTFNIPITFKDKKFSISKNNLINLLKYNPKKIRTENGKKIELLNLENNLILINNTIGFYDEDGNQLNFENKIEKPDLSTEKDNVDDNIFTVTDYDNEETLREIFSSEKNKSIVGNITDIAKNDIEIALNMDEDIFSSVNKNDFFSEFSKSLIEEFLKEVDLPKENESFSIGKLEELNKKINDKINSFQNDEINEKISKILFNILNVNKNKDDENLQLLTSYKINDKKLIITEESLKLVKILDQNNYQNILEKQIQLQANLVNGINDKTTKIDFSSVFNKIGNLGNILLENIANPNLIKFLKSKSAELAQKKPEEINIIFNDENILSLLNFLELQKQINTNSEKNQIFENIQKYLKKLIADGVFSDIKLIEGKYVLKKMPENIDQQNSKIPLISTVINQYQAKEKTNEKK